MLLEQPRIIRILVLASLLSLPSVAQVAPSTSLSGTVVDASGGSVPKASVELTNTGTQFTRRTSTSAQGRFLFNLAPPGLYDLAVTAAGFAPYRQHGITLDVNTPASIAITLSIRAAAEQVTVQANAPMVDTESGTLRQIVSGKYIQDLPLNGRNAASLVYMAPGTVAGKGTDTATYASTSDTIAVSVNGTFGDQVSYKLDGATHQDSITNLNAAFPNPDALAEFSVETNNFDARYGGSGGAVVNIVTKSGTNALHGSLFEYLRNGDLNARNFFAPQHDALKRNQFGGAAGGPIRKDKLFFFGSYQGTTVDNTSYGNTAFVPTAAMRQGDFSSLPKPPVNPATGKAFPGAVIPVSLFSPVSAAMLDKIPTSSDPAGKLLYAVPSNTRNHQLLAKADYNAGAHQISASFFFVHYTDPGWNANNTLLNYKLGQVQTTQEFKASDTYTIKPNLLNSFTIDGLILDSTQTRTAPFSIFDFGNLNVTKPAAQFQETAVSVTGFSGWGSGGAQPPGEWIRNNFEISEMLTWVRGSHSMHMGADITPYVRFDSSTGYQEEPVFNFNGSFTGNGLADFLLGRVNTFTQTAGKAKFTRGPQVSGFFQDNWRIGSRFSLDLGLRWDPFLPYTDPVAQQVGGYIAGYRSTRFPNAPSGLAFAGDPGFPSAGMYANLPNFAPRAGFSWTAIPGTHSTIVRGGWGMFYIQPFVRLYNNFVQNAPFSPSETLFGVNLDDPYGSAGVTNPFPPFAPVHPGANTQFVRPLQYQYFNPNWHVGHTNAFNFTIEHQLQANLVLRAAYVGTEGRDLQFFQEQNPAVFGPGATIANTNARRPLAPDFASLIQMTNGGVSNYNALQVTVERRLNRQIAFVANYTYSKSLDNLSVDSQFTVSNPDPFNSGFNYGRSDFDTPHNFSFWGLWDLPKMASSPWLIKGPLGGWEMTGIWTWHSGTPFSVTSGQDRSLSGTGLDRADVNGDPSLSAGRPRNDVINQYFNVTAFALNAPGTFGTAPRNLLWNPRYANLDWSLQKSFPLSEQRRIQLRADFFNVFNNVHLNAPGSNLSSASTFGKINGAGEPRIVQVALRFAF
ncbi:MAG: carboxypeptidase regulatory-like domain-containing protein [Bryobacteraceae bacterium]